MQHYFKLIGQPVYFGYNNGRTIRIDYNASKGLYATSLFSRSHSDDYQLFSAGSPNYEPIGAEHFSQILTEVNDAIQAEVQTQLSLSIIKS
jgi:hypothetical protein